MQRTRHLESYVYECLKPNIHRMCLVLHQTWHQIRNSESYTCIWWGTRHITKYKYSNCYFLKLAIGGTSDVFDEESSCAPDMYGVPWKLSGGTTTRYLGWGYLYLSHFVHMTSLTHFNSCRNPLECEEEPLCSEKLESW
jgi:hypothetical protein